MGSFDLGKSLQRTELRLGTSSRRSRSDAGASRLHPRVIAELRRRFHGLERPKIKDVQLAVGKLCARHRLRPPSRATIYNFIALCPPHQYVIAKLPSYVREALYNLDGAKRVPGHQLAFYAFQYGDADAARFAAGLPWLDLYQADRMRGWRRHSHSRLRSVLQRRAIA